jgi:TatD DNase family protein
MWFDTHCHLYDLADDVAALERARRAGVAGILVVGVDPPTNEKALRLAGVEGVWAGAAFHPSAVKGWKEEWITEIETFLSREKVVAVGETGIDLYWDDSYFDDQVAAFEAHVDLAKKYEKALVIHTRNSLNETLEILERVGPPERPIFHCWSGDPDQVRRAVDIGAFISFAGNVSFKSAQGLREAACEVPRDRLLVETDSPFLTPVPHRGKTNEPAYVALVGAVVAEARGVEPDEVARLTTSNAHRAFGLET